MLTHSRLSVLLYIFNTFTAHIVCRSTIQQVNWRSNFIFMFQWSWRVWRTTICTNHFTLSETHPVYSRGCAADKQFLCPHKTCKRQQKSIFINCHLITGHIYTGQWSGTNNSLSNDQPMYKALISRITMWHYNLYPRGSLYSLLCKSWKEPHTISAVSMHPIKVNAVSSENLAYCIANKQNVQK